MDRAVKKMYKIKPLAEGLYGISSSAVMCWLIVGKTGAMLIDTAYGFEDLSAVIREITSLPLTVVNSHGHVDHSGGNFYFDVKVCIHEADVEVYRFPSQIRQTDALLRYLIDHAEELNLDMSRVCLAGSSAGADMTEIYAACVCNRDYAGKLGVSPVMTTEQLRVLAVDEAALEAGVFDSSMYAMLGCWTGAKKNTPEATADINAKTFIRSTYIPTWVNASNEGGETGFFITEARALKAKLDAIGVPCEMTYFPGENHPHGYMDQLDTEPHAKEAFDTMMAFIKKYI